MTEPDIELRLTVAEVNTLLQVVGDLPTRSGAWPLLTKITGQAQACLAAQETTDAHPVD
jgi:hypothetical protein